MANSIYEPRSVNGDFAWNVVTASSGALNHLFGIARIADVARKKTCERRPIHQSKVVLTDAFMALAGVAWMSSPTQFSQRPSMSFPWSI